MRCESEGAFCWMAMLQASHLRRTSTGKTITLFRAIPGYFSVLVYCGGILFAFPEYVFAPFVCAFILQKCRHHETHNLGRPTVRNYTNFNGHQLLHQPAKPYRHKHHPLTTTMGADTAIATHSKEGPSFACHPFGSPQIVVSHCRMAK